MYTSRDFFYYIVFVIMNLAEKISQYKFIITTIGTGIELGRIKKSWLIEKREKNELSRKQAALTTDRHFNMLLHPPGPTSQDAKLRV
jgi:hypothetical protein